MEKEGRRELVRVVIEYGKQKLQAKFLANTKVLSLEEYIKRTIKMSPT